MKRKRTITAAAVLAIACLLAGCMPGAKVPVPAAAPSVPDGGAVSPQNPEASEACTAYESAVTLTPEALAAQERALGTKRRRRALRNWPVNRSIAANQPAGIRRLCVCPLIIAAEMPLKAGRPPLETAQKTVAERSGQRGFPSRNRRQNAFKRQTGPTPNKCRLKKILIKY